MSELQRHFASIANAEHLAALCAESLVYFYWGDDKEQIRQRMAQMQIVLIGANLDTEVFWINSLRGDFPAFYESLRTMCGPDDILFAGEGS